MKSITPRLTLLLVALAPLGACDSLGLGSDESVEVSFATPRAGNGSVRAALVADTTILVGGHTLTLQSIDLTVEEVVLERDETTAGGDSDGDSEADSDSDGPSNEKVRTGAMTVALPVNGGIVTPINADVPAGLYEKIEIDVAFVRVRGTYDGQAFDVTVPVNKELELEFEPALEVDGDANVTIKLEPLTWFRASDGSLIDPRALNSNSSLRSAFVRRVETSFKAIEDSDKDADDTDSDSDSDRR